MIATEMTDEELVGRTRAGERESFEALVRRHQNLVHGLAYHLLGNFEDARDASQSTFIRAFVRIGELRDPRAFKGWLRRIAEGECRSLIRSRRSSIPLPELEADKGPDLDARLDLERAIKSLPEKDRLVLTLFCFQSRSQREIADFLGVTTDAVMSRLRHARARLRQEHLSMNESTVKENLLPLDWATQIPIPYDEYDWRRLPAATPAPLSEWRRKWLFSYYPEGTQLISLIRGGHEWEREATRSIHLTLRLPGGDESRVEIRASGRRDGSELCAKLLPILAECGIRTAKVVAPPTVDPDLPDWGTIFAVEPLPYRSAISWCLDRGVEYQAYQQACEVVLDGMDRLRLLTDEIVKRVPEIETCSLADELARVEQVGGPWLTHREFRDAVGRLKGVVPEIQDALVFSDSGGGPNVLVDEDGRLFGFGDFSWARIEDPHYAATKFWTYDCYPLRWFGVVERYLVRHGLTMKEFAPRLAVRALVTLQREISLDGGDGDYREDMLGWLRLGIKHLG